MRECSIDYDKNSDTAITFYKTIQNKFHFAITGNTAAEIIYNRVDSKKENMGLTTWENSPDGKILKTDVIIAKNYLNETEIKNLNNLVNLFLDIAENNAERNITMYMEDWKNEVENALKVFHYEVLEGKGNISHKQAVEKAENEYEKYKVIQDKNYVSDFDRLLSETKQIENKYHNVTKDEFVNEVIPKLLKNSDGLELPDGYVPDTYFFLWDDNKIVGLFKIRHYLNDFLRKGAGHIGYEILPEYRGKGYAKQGLLLAIEKCKELIKEDEIYLSVRKTNPASLKVQLGCGAFIVGETDEDYLTRIKLKDNSITFGFRDLRRNDWKRITKKEVIVEDEKNEFFEGKVCYLDMKLVESPLSVDSPTGKVTIADNNYKNLIFAPKGENYWLTVMFDDQDNLIENYFDITRTNDFSNPENPYFVDMKLDVCIPNCHEPTIMDEEELKEVYEHGLITEEDFENAYNIANKIIRTYNSHKEDYYNYIYSLYNKYRNNKTKRLL